MFFDPEFSSSQKAEPAAPQGLVVWMRNKFLAGLAVVTPLMITFLIIQFVYNVLHGWADPALSFIVQRINESSSAIVIDPESQGYKQFVNFIGVLVPVLVILALGAMATNVIGARVMEAVDRLLSRIPLISFIYKSLKQVIDAFKGLGGKQGFKRVVYVDYPVPGMWMLGFVTGQFYDRIRKCNMTSVFLPCAPSPMTGMLVVVETERISDAPMTMEEAMKMIFSGGLVGPNNAAPRGNSTPAPTSDSDLPAGLPTADDYETSIAMSEADSDAPIVQSQPIAEHLSEPVKTITGKVKALFRRKAMLVSSESEPR